ncbi:MAG: hypothetical protein NWF09_08965 [Candidatus Bathyarchaeota archaeon]|nr:hypothetical protein [Candidatus Bathyarchaeota archaeon]
MSEPVNALWFEDVGFLNEPFLDTPFGKYSVRQMIILLSIAGISFASTLFFDDLLLKLVIAGSVFVVGAAFFMRRVKTLTPEKHLMLILGFGRAIPKTALKKQTKKAAVKPQTVTAKSMTVTSELETPVKIVGVVQSPSTGKKIVNNHFDVYVDGKYYSSGITDEMGFFELFLSPDHYGTYNIEIKPKDTVESMHITVVVNPKRGAEIV